MKGRDLVIPAVLLQSIELYDSADVAAFMRDIFPAMVNLFEAKDKNYGGSWQKQGILGVHANFNRKVDRVHTQFFSGTLGELTNENINDTFVDAANYSVMYLYFLYKKFPFIQEQVLNFIAQYK